MRRTDKFCVLVTNEAGRVAAQMGCEPCELTDSNTPVRDLGGLTWLDALRVVAGSEAPLEVTGAVPTSFEVECANGRLLRVSIAALSSGRWKGGRLVVLQDAGDGLDVRAQRFCTLGMLAAGAAHEMNNLLTLASGWLEVGLAQEDVEEGRRDPLRKAQEAIEQMSILSNSLLDFARSESKQERFADVNRLVHRVIALVDYQLEKDNVRLAADLPGESLLVEAGEGELSQTLLNLIMNARQAMPHGGAIHLSAARQDGWVVIEVRDTGCGIPRDAQERVFDPFFSTRRGQGGTGLGLAVCKQIVERRGGELTLTSEPGAGTSVTVRLAAAMEGVRVAGD